MGCKKSKKLISIALSAFIAMTIFVFIDDPIAYASTGITSASATITEPVGNERPDFNAEEPAEAKYLANVSGWYEGTTISSDTKLNDVDRFTAGETYTAVVLFIPKQTNSYHFSEATFTVNGKNTAAYSYNAYTGSYSRTISFVATEAQDTGEKIHAEQYSGHVISTCINSSDNSVFSTVEIGLEIRLDGLYNDSTIKASDFAETFNPVWIRNSASDQYYTFKYNKPDMDSITVTDARLRWAEDSYTTFAKTAEGVVYDNMSQHKDHCRTTSSFEIFLQHTCNMEPIIDVQPTCTEDGQGHDVCTVCGHVSESYGLPAAHSWESDYTTDREPTCTVDGLKSIHCSACEATKDEETILAAHRWEDCYTIDIPATCTKDGLKTIHCKGCNETKEKTVIPAVGHDNPLKHVEAKTQTCTQDGNIEYWLCTKCNTCFGDANANYVIPKNSLVKKATGHKWDAGEVTKKATSTTAGTKTFTCTVCKKTKTESIPKLKPSTKSTSSSGNNSNQKGKDGTDVGIGASAASAHKAITGMKSDTDPVGAKFSILQVKSSKQTKSSITLKWTKTTGAVEYVIYGNQCGNTKKPVKLTSVTGNTMTFNTVAGQKLKKGTYYKFIIVALDKKSNVVSTSKLIHVATKGGKVGNHKKVKVKKSVTKKAKKLKVGKSLKLKAKTVKQKKKVKKHVGVRYESSNNSIATVSNKGVVKAKKKGTCYIYAYAQNGVFKKITVTVK